MSSNPVSVVNRSPVSVEPQYKVSLQELLGTERVLQRKVGMQQDKLKSAPPEGSGELHLSKGRLETMEKQLKAVRAKIDDIRAILGEQPTSKASPVRAANVDVVVAPMEQAKVDEKPARTRMPANLIQAPERINSVLGQKLAAKISLAPPPFERAAMEE